MDSIYHEQKRVNMDISTEYFALSQPQKSIWYLEQKYPDTCMNVIAGTLRLKGQIDYAALERAINLTIRNNDGLRIHVREKDGDASQYLSPYIEKKLDFIDFSHGNGVDDLYRWDAEQTKVPFDLYDSDLCYFAIFKIDEENGGVYSKMHHMIADAWSISVTANSVMGYYSAMKKDLSIENVSKPSFFEHLASEKKYEESERFLRDREYWNAKFEAFPEPTILKPQALNSTTTNSGRKTFIIPQKLSDKIREYCAGNNVSVFTLFLSALSIYIHRVTGTEDIILGTTTLNRINSREKDTIGMFVSVAAPIRIQMSDTQNFLQFSNEMLKETVSILKHQKYPYNYLIRDLKKKHKLPGRLFDIVLNYQNTKLVTKKSEEEFATRWHFSGHQVESLVIHINDRDDNGKYIFDYDFLAEVYNAKEIEYLHQHVISLLWHALDNPERAISRLEMLSEKEKHQILYEFNNTAAEFPRDKTLHEFLYAQAKKTPDSVAVIYGDQQMTYCEVNERSNQLARILREKGVKSDTVVGISVFRSFEMIIGLMAILKAGGAYLPMDPDYPQDRIQYMMNDSSSAILLTQRELSGRFDIDADVLSIDDEAIYTGDPSDLSLISGPDNLAYIIYTSGSTGKPKGVMIEHAGVINRLHWGSKKYPISESDIMLQKTPFTFDVSVWELFWWSLEGASVCMLEPGGEKNPETILKTVEKNKVTIIHFVPSMLSAFLNFVEMRSCSGRLASIKKFFASGEALTIHQTDLFNRLLNKSNGSELFNLYGPTEATVEVSYFDCSPKVTLKAVPIGKPIDNIHLYVLDNCLGLLPIGIPGELYIGGVGVARGYMNNPILTAEKFLPDPFFPGQRIYKTGDRVRWFPKGDIEYLGRIDFQVKIRGFRIELGEIESHLMKHNSVKDAVVVGSTHNNSSVLCAYITTKRIVQITEIKEHLAKDLPEYMIPTFFVVLDMLPLSPNGKVDRKALPMPDVSHVNQEEYSEPENNVERSLADIWSRILQLEKVSTTESFFQIGGDSLLAISLITEIHKLFDVEVPVSEIFRLQTIRKIGEYLLRADRNLFVPITTVPEMEFYPMSSSQKRLYVLNKFDEKDISYNLPGVLLIEGEIDVDKLESAFCSLIERHESLRTSFDMQDGQPVQKIHKHAAFSIERIKSTDRSINAVMKKFVRPFDLSSPPLLRVGFLELADGAKYLLMDMHHIVSDGSSINVLIRDISCLYSSQVLTEIKTQYKDFSAWQINMLSEEDSLVREKYWLDQFSGEIPILNMPTDFPRPSHKSFLGKRVSFSIGRDLTAEMRRLAIETGTTLYMVMFCAYNILLSKYSSQEDITVGMPVEGRLNADLKNLIGMFVNTVAIRSYPEAGKSFMQLLHEVKDNLLAAYQNQEYPFEELVDKVNARRDLSRNPLFDTVFILQNMDISQIELCGARLTPYKFESGTSKFDITLEAFEGKDSIELSAEYCTELFEESTILCFLAHYGKILDDALKEPCKAISEIEMLLSEEKIQLLGAFDLTNAEFPREKTLHQIFEEQVEKTPDNIAVCLEDETLSYRELNSRSNQLARLIRDKGIGPDDIVGVILRRSIDMIIGIFAVLKAGGAYLPMDPDYPAERNQYTVRDSGAKLLLTQPEFADDWEGKIEVLSVRDTEIDNMDSSNLAQRNTPADLAYIIYTSGSTGKPKGVMIEHVNVVRLLFNDMFQFPFASDDVWTLFHSYCFDFSVWEMYGALLYGARLLIISKEDARDTAKFFELVRREKVTVLNQTPGAFYNFIQEDVASSQDNSSLRYVIFGGEALKPVVLKPFHKKHPNVKLINMYGITETTVHVTYKEIGAEEIEQNISNIGKAIPTLKTYIVDRNLNLLPVGVPGELCVAGSGVGRGYVNNDEYTKMKFVPNPFHRGERLYRSGDLARVSINGDIEYLGRIDSQVKIRGYRIELGEIESELLKFPQIKETVVVPRENNAGEKRLYAYYVSDERICNDELRAALAKYLPDYMVPSIFIHLEKMPLNRNGKVDRDNLPQNEDDIRTNEFVAPSNDTEKMIADLWGSILELSLVGITDNFFHLGGDSLSAIRVISKMNEMKVPVTLVDFYKNPTIEQLAKKVQSESSLDSGEILVRLTPSADNSLVNIICFPYGGGNAISYKRLGDAIFEISKENALFAVNIPGHDIGGSDELVTVEEVSNRVFREIRDRISGKIILYGHCVGNALLLETAQLLENEGIEIETVIFGAIYPPPRVKLYGKFFDPWMLYSDKRVISYLQRIGLPKSSMENEYSAFIIKAFRHDARNFYRYFYNRYSKGLPRIKTSCLCVVGENDAITKKYDTKYLTWEAFCSNLKLCVIENADHYFINSHAKNLAEIICSELNTAESP